MPHHRSHRKWLLLASSTLALASIACRSSRVPAAPSEASASSPATSVPAGNPFAGIAMYRAPWSNAENAQRAAEKTNPAESALFGKIAAQPQSSWFGGWSGDIKTAVGNYVNAAERAGQLPVLVAYNVPNRDCGQYSAGGAADVGAYATWISWAAISTR